ncbi:bifunctional metallophosphatase/5'-nucleotidase [Calditrichota bacterium]
MNLTRKPSNLIVKFKFKKNGDIVKKYLLIVFSVIFCAYAQEKNELIILHTTDVHGNIYSYDYFRDQPSNSGLSRIYTKVKEYRQKYKNVLLLDSGDLLQGTPLVYYFNHINTSLPNPMILVMNYMRYDAFAVGNHDIEQGYFTYYKAMKESDFPWLSANGEMTDGSTYFKPYTIIEKDGIKIGIIGLTTPAIPMWLDKSLYPGIEWKDMVVSAKKYAQELRSKVDVLIGLFHAGMNAEYNVKYTDTYGIPNENASKLVAENVPDFDIILCGHSHRVFPTENENPLINNTVMVMSGSHGSYLGVVKINFEKTKITSRSASIIPMESFDPAQEILAITKPYHEQTLKYIRQEIGTVLDTLSAKNSYWQDTPLVELINRAQMAATGADMSFAASFNQNVFIPPGPILVKDIYGMYRYENFLYLVEMSGQQIIDYLEYCARFFIYDNKTNKVIKNPEMAGYNYDMAEGISYVIDVSEESGDRIKEVIVQKSGEPIDLHGRYKVTLNSYRASGGGGHLAAIGINKPKILWQSNEEMRNILIEYIRDKGQLDGKVDGNWKLVK